MTRILERYGHRRAREMDIDPFLFSYVSFAVHEMFFSNDFDTMNLPFLFIFSC